MTAKRKASKTKKKPSKQAKTKARPSASKKPKTAKTTAPAKKKTAKKVTKVAKKVTKKNVAKVKQVSVSVAKSKPAKKAGKTPAKAARRVSAAPRRPPLDLGKFRRELLQKQAEMFEAYVSAKGNSRSRESDGTEDYIDYAVSSYDREFLLSLTELDRDELKLVEEALARIDKRQFGLCVQCERVIPTKRLDVQPWARYCLQCQELADSGQGGEGFEFPDSDDAVASGSELDDDVDEDETEEVRNGRLAGG